MFDLGDLRQRVARHGLVARIVIASHAGSSPREDGAAMLVWPGGSSGTIGGGALEYLASARALEMLTALSPMTEIRREALGPNIGQCCGGAVTLVTEVFHAGTLPAPAPEELLLIRPLSPEAAARPLPLSLQRLKARARAAGSLPPGPLLDQGWLAEPLARPQQPVWIWGAGHVGRAICDSLSPLPQFALTWVDTAAERFPERIAEGVRQRVAARPEGLICEAPHIAWHLIVTYSHALDLEICHRLLASGASEIGLIGSASKAARFASRLSALGHAPGQIARIHCPMGDITLGKHPQAIALGVAVQLLKLKQISETEIADDRKEHEGAGAASAAGGPD